MSWDNLDNSCIQKDTSLDVQKLASSSTSQTDTKNEVRSSLRVLTTWLLIKAALFLLQCGHKRARESSSDATELPPPKRKQLSDVDQDSQVSFSVFYISRLFIEQYT